MPRIDASKGRDRGIGANITAARAINPGDFGLGQLSRAISDAGAQRMAEETRQREEREGLEMTRALNQSRVRFAENVQELEGQYDGSKPGFADTVRTRLDLMIESELDAVPDSRRDEARARLETTVGSLQLSAMDYEGQRRQSWQLRGVREGLEQSANAVRTDPGLFFDARGDLDTIVAAAPPEMRAALREEGDELLFGAFADAQIEEDPRGFLAAAENGDYNDVASTAQLSSAISGANRAIARQEAEAERRANEQRALAIASYGSAWEDHVASIASTGVGLSGFDEEENLSLLTPGAAATRRAQLAAAHATYDATRDLRGLSADDMAVRLAELAPEPGSSGYAQAAEIYANARSAMEDHLTRRGEDPAQYAFTASTVQDAAQALAAAQEGGDAAALAGARIAYADAQWAEQARLGVPEYQRRIMSPAQLQREIAALEAVDVAERPQAIRAMIDRVNSYGDYAPQVFSELRDAGLDPVMATIAEIPDPGAQTVMIRAAANMDALEARLETRDRSDLQDSVGRELSRLTDSLAETPGGYAAADNMQSAAYLYALDAMARGASRNDAARRAAELFTGQYAYQNDYRIPRAVADRPQIVRVRDNSRMAFDQGRTTRERTLPAERLIAHGAEIALDGLRANEGANLLLIEGEGDLVSRGRITANRIATNSQWVTTAEDDGLMLVANPGDGITTPVLLADGMEVRFSWQELSEMGRARFERENADPADVLQPVLNARRDIPEDVAGVRPRGRSSGRGWQNAPWARVFYGDDRQTAANDADQAARAADLLEGQ